MIHNGETVAVPSRGIEMGTVWMKAGCLETVYTIRDCKTHELVKVTEDEIERCGFNMDVRGIRDKARLTPYTLRNKR